MDALLSSDGIRLLIIPILLWAAWSDIQTRRVPNETWIPVLAIGVIAGLVDMYHFATGNMIQPQLFIYTVALTIGITIPFALFVYVIGGFGGADVKALIAFAIVFPTTPTYVFNQYAIPIVEPTHGIFPLTIFGNALFIAILIIPTIVLVNIVRRDFSPVMFIGLQRRTTSLSERYGSLLETTTGFTRRGTDLDILNEYKEWVDSNGHDGTSMDTAEEFLDSVEYTYGATPETLTDSFTVVTENSVVWVSPGTPFFVPLCIGLLIGLTHGDVLITAFQIIGL